MAVSVIEKPRPGVELPAIRRFQTADLNTHGKWLLERLTKAMNIDERAVASWLNSVLFSREYMVLFQPHSVALAQMHYGDALDRSPVIHVKFVLAMSEAHVDEAAGFYENFRRWGESLGAKVMVLPDTTDVPDDVVKKVLGRVFTKQQMFARV